MTRKIAFALIIVLFFVAPVLANEPEKVKLIDPIDGTKVTGYALKAFTTTGTDRDFCYLYAGQSLYDLWIACSPTSGYCGYNEDFAIHLRPDVKQKISEQIKPNYDLSRLAPWDRYEITAQIYIWRNKPNMDIANAYLRATYTMRGKPLGPELRQKEKEFRSLAIKYLKKADKAGEFKLHEIATLKYLIGELYRRNEQYKKAIKHFDNISKFKNKPEWLDKWIQEQTAKAIAEYPY